MKQIKKILVVADDSQAAMKEGVGLARKERCYVTALRVLPCYEGDVSLVGIKNIDEVLSSGGDKALDDMQHIATEENYHVKTRVEYGDLYEKVIETADEEKCDLIVIAVQKMNWLKRLIKGSITDRIINNAQCPVLVVRP